MRFATAKEFMDLPHKAITIFGMSGVGKTTLAQLLRDAGWFHYSVDYRIGTRYMGEHIVDNFKREAMKNPFLADLLKKDSIYISSNISFENLSPLSTYLGKPGNRAEGGLSFAEYEARQAQHRIAEIASLLDVPEFISKAQDIYGYPHFICDSGGSLCEVVDPNDANDPVIKALTDHSLLLYIRGTPEHARMLVERFRKDPKPMYYQPEFLQQKWAEYKKLKGLSSDEMVNPDDFIAWGFEELVHHRIPLYETIAKNYGYAIEMDEIPALQNEADFLSLISRILDKR
jgi:hypothetical protein